MIIDLKEIKKIYINLDKATDRKHNFEKYMSELNYKNVERYSAKLLQKIRDFNHGCSASHEDVMIKNKNNIPFILMEDDVKYTKWYNEYVNDGKIEIPNDSDIVYLGFSTAGSWNTLGVNFYCEEHDDKWLRLHHCLATHALLFITNTGLNTFIDSAQISIKNKVPLDIGYAKNTMKKLKIYAPKKPIFYQANGCWPTTHVNVDTSKNEWISIKENGEINFVRKYTNG